MELDQAKGLFEKAGVSVPKIETPVPEKGHQRWTARLFNWLRTRGDYIVEAGIVIFLSASVGLATAGINAPFSQDPGKFVTIAAGAALLTGIATGVALACAERKRTKYLNRYFRPQNENPH